MLYPIDISPILKPAQWRQFISEGGVESCDASPERSLHGGASVDIGASSVLPAAHPGCGASTCRNEDGVRQCKCRVLLSRKTSLSHPRTLDGN